MYIKILSKEKKMEQNFIECSNENIFLEGYSFLDQVWSSNSIISNREDSPYQIVASNDPLLCFDGVYFINFEFTTNQSGNHSSLQPLEGLPPSQEHVSDYKKLTKNFKSCLLKNVMRDLRHVRKYRKNVPLVDFPVTKDLKDWLRDLKDTNKFYKQLFSDKPPLEPLTSNHYLFLAVLHKCLSGKRILNWVKTSPQLNKRINKSCSECRNNAYLRKANQLREKIKSKNNQLEILKELSNELASLKLA
jgi:hypothetical protein